MLIDQALLQIAIVFIPGLIWASLEIKYATRRRAGTASLLVKVFVFGVASYALLGIAYAIFGVDSLLFDPNVGRSELLNRVRVLDVVWATIISVPASVIWIYVLNRKLVTRFLQAIGATQTYGEEDVWDYVFNSLNRADVEFVHVRDFEKELVYAGWVELYSEATELRELHMRDVKVYNFAGEELYEMAWVYIARDRVDLTIEFPGSAQGGDKESLE